jgi:hypothetical protein
VAKGVQHFKKDGTLHTGGTHKMPNGEVHSGKTHGKTSVRLYHLKDLSAKAKEKAMAYNYGPKKKKKPTKRGK